MSSTRMWCLWLSAALAVLFGLPTLRVNAEATADEGRSSPPSVNTVVLLVVDDLGTADLGHTGSQIKTPNLDGIAKEGAVLTNYYVMRACSPTRASLMTGRYTIRYGFQSGVLKPAKPYGLSLKETLLPQYLAQHGFESHMVGKWHLGFYKWAHTPTFRGFASFYGYLTGAEDYYTHTVAGGFDFRLDDSPNCGMNCSQVRWEDQGIYSTYLLTDRAVKLITETSPDQKLFLYLPYQSVHEPREVPSQYSAPYNFSNPDRTVFAGMLSCLDEGIGNVTSAIKTHRDWGSTLFVVTNDNGAPTTGCGGTNGGQNWPRRGGKCSAWDGGLRGVSFVRGPGISAGTQLNDLAHAIDWLPTIVGFVSGMNTNVPGIDGINHMAQLIGDDSAPSIRDTLLLESDPYASPLDKNFGGDQHSTPYYALRHGDLKLIIGDPGQPGILDAWYCTGPPCPASHNNSANASSVPTFNVTSVQLFNLTSDPSEVSNIAQDYPGVVTLMTKMIIDFNKTAVSSAQQGLPDDPASNPSLHNGTVSPWM